MTPLSPPAPESPAAKLRRLEQERDEAAATVTRLDAEIEAAREAEKTPFRVAASPGGIQYDFISLFGMFRIVDAAYAGTLVKLLNEGFKGLIDTAVDDALAADRAARAAEAVPVASRAVPPTDQVRCHDCGRVGSATDEFVSPYSGLCVKCAEAVPAGELETPQAFALRYLRDPDESESLQARVAVRDSWHQQHTAHAVAAEREEIAMMAEREGLYDFARAIRARKD